MDEGLFQTLQWALGWHLPDSAQGKSFLVRQMSGGSTQRKIDATLIMLGKGLVDVVESTVGLEGLPTPVHSDL